MVSIGFVLKRLSNYFVVHVIFIQYIHGASLVKKIHGNLYIKVSGPCLIILWLTSICCGSCNKKDLVVIWV